MPVRTLTVTESAYERLAAMKRPGESFTDVILRVTSRRSLAQLAEAFSPGEARALAESVLLARDERREGRRRAR
jgi:predicted CopG family antitoxin